MRIKSLQGLPYLVHTNRELGLMLRGLKPLACFRDYAGHEPDSVLRYLRMFDRHVELGRFKRRERILPDRDSGLHLRSILYALPGEEWRMDALLELHDAGGGWSADRERREGMLLGYKQWEIEAWLDHLRRRGIL